MRRAELRIAAMPGASLLALLDDISSVLDDVAALTKVASAKTAGVLGDDLALNAEQVSGVRAERELPVVWAVARGSLLNKAILIPLALGLSALLPWSVPPLLMVGGAYLCFEGAEKVLHSLSQVMRGGNLAGASARPKGARVLSEAQKIKGAIRTDFVLSAEIVTIALAVVKEAPFLTRCLALIAIGILMTIGVYGVVAIIIKLDDLGRYLCRAGAQGRTRKMLGIGLLRAAPRIMNVLSVVGTFAMFLVGGGIIVHGAHVISELGFLVVSPLGRLGPFVISIANALLNALVGFVTGVAAWATLKLGKRWVR